MAARVRIDQFAVSSTQQANRTVSKIRGSRTTADTVLASQVSQILDQIRKSGDKGLVRLTRKLDSSRVRTSKDLKVSPEEIKNAYRKMGKERITALKVASKQISQIATQQMKRFVAKKFSSPLRFVVEERYVPFRRVGGYVPGGLASYPSTVLMICMTAMAAGVEDVVIATPPRKNGSIDESVLVAADICGVKEIIKAGGAQAIGALAFGTQNIRRVDFIAGPGNQYVTEAKRQVSASGQVLIDSLAGPTELLIIADKSADPALVSEDLISQAEHGNRTLCGLVSDSKRIVQCVVSRLASVSDRPRFSQIQESKLFAVLVPNKSMMVEFAQRFAPEHLELMVAGSSIKKWLTNSGLVLVGNFTPCSSTDYIAGTNHILPTGGTARVSSGLGVENFLKRVTLVSASKNSLEKASKFISILADMESLPNHGSAVLERFRGR